MKCQVFTEGRGTTKKELVLMLRIMKKENELLGAIDYSTLNDEEASETNQDHEVISRVCAMLEGHLKDTFGGA